MAVSNRDRVGRAFELLAAGVGPFVDRRVRAKSPHGDRWLQEWQARERGEASLMDPSFQLKVMADAWDSVFRDELTRSDRNLVFELRDVRNKWAHNATFSTDDTYRALDSIERLLVSVDATEASDVGRAKDELMRLRYEADARRATPAQDVLQTAPSAGLKPWREVIVPHDDVARGRFALAEFAADLHQVFLQHGSTEYVNPVEFFHRTYLTAGLRTLLAEAIQRMTTDAGVPVVDLQTNFGGGKTHSQIALWHLFSGTPIHAFPQDVQDLVTGLGVATLPSVRRAVLVGTKVAPGQPSIKADGTLVRTLWGELAWQLGAAEGFALLAESDRTSTSPGDNLRILFERYAPCVVLVDEWVAYARQLGGDELPGGTFDTQFSFAQALTEAARAVPRALLVVSLPASEAIGTGTELGSDIELGGAGGREALRRLRSVIGRMESSWRPATAEESFEIVRRRLFKPIEPAALPGRDATARVFGELYLREAAEFPVECREAGYVERIKAAYPLHPELFARLYEDWSTLDRFQRTRGVLRLMAAVIHALWEGGDQSPLILPASLPLSEPAVAAELTRNLEDSWKPIIDSDIDGPNALPMALDRELPGTLGKFQAARRVARTVFLGSAPKLRSANRGIDAARIRLGCVYPGETIATFGDALNRLSSRATYLYADAGRYWYGIQPSVAQVARSRAERLLNDARVDLHAEIVRRLREDARSVGDLRGVHASPTASADVSDIAEARLVILPPDRAHVARSTDSPAMLSAAEILERRGAAPREYRNMLVFLAPDNRRLDELERGVAEFLAWRSIDAEAGADGLNLDPNQSRQAATKRSDSDRMVGLRLAETYQWLVIPVQPDPTGPLTWSTVKAEGQLPLAARVSRKLLSEAQLYTGFPPTLLRQRLDAELHTLWEDGHVGAGALWDAFARYVYLPRLQDINVLLRSVASGPTSTAWQQEGFPTADSFDEKSGRYVGLVAGGHPQVVTLSTLVVQPALALAQFEAEPASPPPSKPTPPGDPEPPGAPGGPEPLSPGHVKRFYGVVPLDAERLNRDFGRVAQEVVQHFTSLVGTDVEVTVEVRAVSSATFPEALIRTVTENARTLKFTSHEFESE